MSNQVPDRDEPPEHLRFAAYLQALAQVRYQEERSLMTEVLTDPDPAMAQSAVVRHLDRRATDLLKSPEYATWAQAMVKVLEPHPFLVQRLHEWSLFRAVALAQPWLPGALTDSSDWLQRKIVESLDTSDALAVLAETGRTRRVRNTARTTLTTRSKRA
ncbi:hypothetical protein ACFC5Z_27110 [Streptomyces sp. NPDC056004]|uniref:hypothetical protein n=1 Tax=Streptomyces sp. NPDC056004 TaxID=3345677 RepID=UPI0035D8B778